MIAYKVIRKENSWYSVRYVSCIMKQRSMIVYKVGEWINTDHACCFKKLKDAKRFIDNTFYDSPISIYRCKIKRSKTYRVRNIGISYTGSSVSMLQAVEKKSKCGNWPIGTIFASRVKLLEEIK